jgi:hypothetical protein
MMWELKHPRAAMDMLGVVPDFLSDQDHRSARDQINERYVGGWKPISGFSFPDEFLRCPDEPPRPLIAETKLRDETIKFYNGAWVAIIQPTGEFEVSRLD